MMKKYSILFLWFVSAITTLFAQDTAIVNKYTFGDGIRLSDKNGNKVRMTGYLQPFAEFRNRINEEDPSETRFRMRRLRLRIEGSAAQDKLSYRFQTDLSGTGELLDGNNNYLLDAFVAYNLARRVKITFGQRAPYTDNRELFMNSNSLQLVERSRVTSVFAAIREFGFFLDGTFRLNNSSTYIKPYLTLTNGDGPNVFKPDLGGLKYGGRLDILPFGLFNKMGQFNQVDIVRELTPKLVFGVTYSYINGVSSRRGRESGSIVYLDDNNNPLLPDYMKFGVDFMLKYRGFCIIGEYMNGNGIVPNGITQRVRNDGSVASTFLVNGMQDVSNYIKGRMMVGDAFNIQGGYLFPNGISIDTRYTHLRAAEHSFMRNPTFYNRPNYYTLGVSKLMGRNYGAKIQGDVTYITNEGDINNSSGNPTNGNELIFRMIATYSF